METVVRDGKFFTVGDNGAEFFNYKRGDIIFNHEQSNQLFKYGRVTSGGGRAKSFANGNAFVEGNAFSNGLGSIYINGSVKTTASGSGSSSSSSEKDFKETFDWIEIAIDRIERAISKLDLTASSVYKNWTTRNKALTDEISKVNEEINLQNAAYNRYIKQANSVGLSEKYAKLVREGKIDISTITDEDLADKIKDFQTWYRNMPLYLVTGGGILFNC